MLTSGNRINAVNVDRVAYYLPGVEYFEGNAISGGVFDVLIRGVVDTKGITNSKVTWLSAKLKVVDQDHFQIQDVTQFVRVSKLDKDVPCDPRRRGQVTGIEALARGLLYEVTVKDLRTAVCWYGVAAELGNAEAQNEYATALFNGAAGLAKDPARAFAFYQKSAMQGNATAAANLSLEFSSGTVAPHSQQRSKYWAARSELNDPDWFHQQVFLPVPSWAADTAGACDARNPPQLISSQTGWSMNDYLADGRPRYFRGSAQAFAQGRVAYQARALETARCWFEVAANTERIDMLPTVADVRERALVYLGILHTFGLGGPKDPARGFES